MSDDEEGQDTAEEGADLDANDDPARARAEGLVGSIVAERYRIHNVLAMGGMGAVFTGEHIHMRKRVALKMLHPDTEGLPGFLARFEREAIVGAHVEHRNIAAARDFGQMADGSYYLVLEFVRGVTLRALLNKGPMPPTRVVRIAKQIAIALGKVHAKGIVHRDVNPRNVMVIPGSKDLVKLIDFGFAKVPVEKFNAMSIQQGTPIAPSQITADGVIFGTIGFLSPEAATGMKSVDARSDLYALGAMLYEMVCGVPPFEGETQGAHYLHHRITPLPPMRERAPGRDVPPALEAIAARLLEKLPEDRYANAEEVVQALEDASVALAPESRGPSSTEAESLPMTVVGEDAPRSLPRFEDVTDGRGPAATDAPVATDDGSPRASSPSGPPPSAPRPSQKAAVASAPARRAAPTWTIAGVVVLIGVVSAIFYARTRGGAAPVAGTPSSVASVTPPAPPRSSGVAPTPSATPTPSAALSASAAPSADAVTEVDGVDAAGWRRVVRQVPSSHDYASATKGVLALAVLDPHAFDGAEMRAAAVDIAVSAGGDHERSVAVVGALGESFGPGGLDVLYDIIATRGGSEAASLANGILARSEARGRGSPALRVALELREAPCASKLDLVERARTEGDERALALLLVLRDPDCDPSTGACCVRDPAIEAAVRELSSRPPSR